MPWNPDLYNKFQAQRAAPFEDLSALLVRRPNLRVVDLGCGTGELTRRLADMLEDSHTVGLDSSPQMLERAQTQARPGLAFEFSTIESFVAAHEPLWDVVFSHAALQWVGDHDTLFPRLCARVAPGGQIAVQMPSNHDHYVQRVVREMAAEPPFQEALNGFVRVSPLLTIDRYAEMLFAAGFEDIIVFEKVYPHVMEDAEAVVQFTSGTVMVPYMERLPHTLKEPFMDEFRRRVRDYFPDSPAFYAFRRTLFAATRPA
jgi:trans-aconitate 2-methyltransferase